MTQLSFISDSHSITTKNVYDFQLVNCIFAKAKQKPPHLSPLQTIVVVLADCPTILKPITLVTFAITLKACSPGRNIMVVFDRKYSVAFSIYWERRWQGVEGHAV